MGCSKNDYEVVPVSGVATCQGQPVVMGYIYMNPEQGQGRSEAFGGKPAMGATDEQGRFKLTTYKGGDGALLGRHKVGVALMDDTESQAIRKKLGVKNVLPCAGQELEIVIERGMNELQLDFTKP